MANQDSLPIQLPLFLLQISINQLAGYLDSMSWPGQESRARDAALPSGRSWWSSCLFIHQRLQILYFMEMLQIPICIRNCIVQRGRGWQRDRVDWIADQKRGEEEDVVMVVGAVTGVVLTGG